MSLSIPEPTTLLRPSESQATRISYSSSYNSSASSSSSSLFDTISGASSECLTDFSSSFIASTEELGNGEGEKPLDGLVKEQASIPSKWGGRSRQLGPSQTRLLQPTNVSSVNQSGRLDRACALGPRSFARSYSRNGTPFLSLMPMRNECRRWHSASDSEDPFDAITAVRNRLERGNSTVATRCALGIIDSGRPPAARLESDGLLHASDISTAQSSVLFPTASDSFMKQSLVLDERDIVSSPMPPNFSPKKPVLKPDISSPSCSPLVLETPDNREGSSSSFSTSSDSLMKQSLVLEERDFVSSPMPPNFSIKKPALKPDFSGPSCSPLVLGPPYNWEGSSSSFSALMAESPPSQISSPKLSFNEEDRARMRTLPTCTRQRFPGSPSSDADRSPSTLMNHASPIVFGKVSVRIGHLTEASVESQSPPAESSSTSMQICSILAKRNHLVAVDESIAKGEVALPPVSDFCLQAQKCLNFKPFGVQKTIELDASQLERQSALYNLEHSALELDHIFSHPPPIRLDKTTEILERQLLDNLFKKQSRYYSKSQRHVNSPSYSSLVRTNNVEPRSVKESAVSDEQRSYQAPRKLGLERFAVFQPPSFRNDSDLISPTATPEDDPRSPNLSTPERDYLTFSSLFLPSPPPVESDQLNHPGTPPSSEVPHENTEIGLGLPSSVAFRPRLRLPELSSTSSCGSTDAIRCQSRSSSLSQECQIPSVIVTVPSFTRSCSSFQSVESSDQFLKPPHFTEGSFDDELPTPPSLSTPSSSRGTPSLRNRWSPFSCGAHKKKSSRFQHSSLSMGSQARVYSDSNGDSLPEPPVTHPRPGFKRFISKFEGLFKPLRSLKTSGLIEHTDAPPGLISSLDGLSL